MSRKDPANRHLASGVRAHGESEFYLLIRYLLVGGAATAVHAAVSITLLLLSDLSPLYGHVVGFTAGFIVSALGHAVYTFRLKRGHGPAIARFFAVALLALVASEAALAVLIGTWGIAPLKAQLAAIAISVVCSFTLARLWAF